MADRSSETVVAHDTGEVFTAAQVARELARILKARDQAQRELHQLNQQALRVEGLLRGLELHVGDRFAGDSTHDLVAAPPARRAAVRVNAEVAAQYQEELLSLDLGSVSYKPPTSGQVRAKRAEVIARGVPWDKLMPEPAEVVELVLVERAA